VWSSATITLYTYNEKVEEARLKEQNKNISKRDINLITLSHIA
jgi:hypothetical protein